MINGTCLGSDDINGSHDLYRKEHVAERKSQRNILSQPQYLC